MNKDLVNLGPLLSFEIVDFDPTDPLSDTKSLKISIDGNYVVLLATDFNKLRKLLDKIEKLNE